jgi:predicted dehydrogenase
MNRGEFLKPEWTGDVNLTGGSLYETTIHFLDMMRFQFGEVPELYAYGSQHEYPEIDEFSVILKFKSGFHCTFASSADASWLFPFERIELLPSPVDRHRGNAAAFRLQGHECRLSNRDVSHARGGDPTRFRSGGRRVCRLDPERNASGGFRSRRIQIGRAC